MISIKVNGDDFSDFPDVEAEVRNVRFIHPFRHLTTLYWVL